MEYLIPYVIIVLIFILIRILYHNKKGIVSKILLVY